MYVLGLNRSGTTIYERFRGSADGVFAAGEIHNIWLWPFLRRPCACGQLLPDCPQWSQVFARLEADTQVSVDEFVADFAALHQRTGRTRDIPKILRRTADARAFAARMQQLYTAIAGATGASTIVDNSKSPSGALLLELMDGVEAEYVRVCRDPIATIQSNRIAPTEPWAPPRIRGSELVAQEAVITWICRRFGRRGKLTTVDLDRFLRDHAGHVLAESHQAEGNPSRAGAAVLTPSLAQAREPADTAMRAEAFAINTLRRLSRRSPRRAD